MGVFGSAQQVVNRSAGVIAGSLNMELALENLAERLAEMGTGELIGLFFESAILSLAMSRAAHA